jgi:DNA polymerase V
MLTPSELATVTGSRWKYWKAGVILNELINATTAPEQMFPTRDPVLSVKLLSTIDSVNQRFGRGAIPPAVSGIHRRWTAKASFLSKRYAT